MKAALDLPLLAEESLKGNFWPTSRFTPSEVDFKKMGHCERNLLQMYLMLVVGEIVRPSLFRVARDVYAVYFFAIRPTDEGTNHPFWIVRAFIDPNSDVSHLNCIWMQYWTPASTHYVDAETYKGWDSTSGNIWHHDRRFDPIWAHMDFIMGAWQSRIREGTTIHKCKFLCYKLQILRQQWSDLKRKMMMDHLLFIFE